MMLIQSNALESICNEVFRLDPKIRFVGIINDKGKLLAENKKEELEVLADHKEQEILLMEIALGARMRKEHDKHLGEVKFTISYGDKVISINFPFSDKILCISAEKEIDVLKITFTGLQLLEARYK